MRCSGAIWRSMPSASCLRTSSGIVARPCPLYAAKLKELRQKRGMSFHLWIRAKGFDEFPGAMLDEDRPKPPERRFVMGEELLGLRVAT
jgi:hypothetical protein